MNQQEIEKHLFFQIAFIVFIVVTMAFTIFWLLTENVNASDLHYDVTNYIYTNTAYCTSNQKGLCVADSSSTSYSRYTFGTTSYQNTLAIDFMLNYTIPANVNATIRLTGKNWANVPYSCSGTAYMTNCRVVRASSTILNINFTSISNGVGGESFHIDANGNILNTNDTFYVQKADLYATYINSSDSTNQDIINNQNQNTEDIINSQNSNTQDIIKKVQDMIANNEELTNQIIESTKCLNDYSYNPEEFMFTNGYINSSGNVVSDSNYMVSPYLQLLPNRSYSIIFGPARSGKYVCVYQGNKQVSQCYEMTGTINFTMGSTSNMLLRVVAVKSNGQFVPVRIKGPICNDWQQMANQKLQGTTDDTNSYLKDDSDPTLDNSAISDTLESVAIDDPLNYLLTLPFHAIQRINYQLGRNSCEPINLGSLYGTDLVLPCINVKEKLGTSLFNLIDTLMGIGILSVTLKKFYDSISNVLTLGKEKEVREKLELPTPMEFLAMIFGGGR